MSARLWFVVACVLVFYGVVVGLRLSQHDVNWFVHFGARSYRAGGGASTVIARSAHPSGPVGYDGQYYFYLAADPGHAKPYMEGNAGVVYSRIGYPMLARAGVVGSASAIPYSMLVINLLAIAALTISIGLWLQARAGPVWPAAVVPLYPGVVFAVFRDLTEPLAFALAALAWLVFGRNLVLSAALFAAALLTRETVILFALAAAVALVPRRRQAIGFAAGFLLPLAVWRVVVHFWIHAPTQERGGSGWGIPFHGILAWRPLDGQHRVIIWTVILPSLLLGLGALLLLVRRRAPIRAALVIANVLAFVVFLPAPVDIDYAAASRAAIGVVLAAVYCAPAWRGLAFGRVAIVAGALASSFAWYLFVTSHYGLDGFQLITT